MSKTHRRASARGSQLGLDLGPVPNSAEKQKCLDAVEKTRQSLAQQEEELGRALCYRKELSQEESELRYSWQIGAWQGHPDAQAIAALLTQPGVKGFYRDLAAHLTRFGILVEVGQLLPLSGDGLAKGFIGRAWQRKLYVEFPLDSFPIS